MSVISAIDRLDGDCMIHDVCYYQCRNSAETSCNAEARSDCFLQCDRELAQKAAKLGKPVAFGVRLAMLRPGKRDPEKDRCVCGQSKVGK